MGRYELDMGIMDGSGGQALTLCGAVALGGALLIDRREETLRERLK